MQQDVGGAIIDTMNATGDTLYCPAYEAIQFLQEKWTLHIIRRLLDGPSGFNELGRAVGGCNSATLAQRLDQLAEMGLITKTVISVMPPRTTYELTPAGRELQDVVGAIDRWARKHLSRPPAPTRPVAE